jgi:polyketide synthase PksJ
MDELEIENERTGLEVAVIGMAGRFPGADNIEQFWDNMVKGIESMVFYSDEELKEVGVTLSALENPNYVRASSRLDNTDYFDALFFNYTPAEVDSMDPQIRLLHEVVWAALEDAGVVPDSDKLSIGLYAGASPNHSWEIATYMSEKDNDSAGRFGKSTLNNKDLLTTRISYNLDLSGPSITLYTACSTSLVAVDQAYRALLTGQCDIALAGGAAVYYPERKGYSFQEGMISSPDGHTRTFDAKGKGSVFGEAVAVVVLKPLEDAVRDRDNIYAVIRGSATNNDGSQKGGYSAVGVKGQADVIKAAMHMARVEPGDVGYIEAHGTATPMGDTVEIKALTSAFDTDKKNCCAVASLKSNVGHLDVAAGVSGFIRAVLALKHRLIPASLHIDTLNPQIDFENSPFFVNTRLMEWKQENSRPRIAGVDSFGVGGCNAHVVLEEWTRDTGEEDWSERKEGRKHQLLLLSAKTETALEKMTQNLAEHLEKNPDIVPADAAYTLQVGRKAFQYRRMLVSPSGDIRETSALLASLESGKVKTYISDRPVRSVVFMFAGLGAQYVNMGRGLYEEEPVFREEMDRCFRVLDTFVDVDLKEILYPRDGSVVDPDRIHQPEISQLAIFIFEYSLARLLTEWGIRPRAMIGYSFGEYVAACAAGVFSLEDGLKLVVARGKAMQTLPEGAMLSIPLSREEVTPILAANPGVSLAIDNGPSCIVAGPWEAVAAVEQQLKQRKMLCMRVPANRAVHTPMMAPIYDEFRTLMSRIILNKPRIPYIANVTGRWATEEEVKDPGYWVKHMGDTVLFADGMKELLKEPGSVFVEIGPGRDIGALTMRHIEEHPDGKHRVLNLVRHPNQDVSDTYLLLNRIGQLWLWSVPVDWEKFHARSEGGAPRRISLPHYPFEGKPYWMDGQFLNRLSSGSAGAALPSGNFADWFYTAGWTRSPLVYRDKTGEDPQTEPFHCLVFRGNAGSSLEIRLIAELEKEGREVVTVAPGYRFQKIDTRTYIVDPREEGDYRRLFKELGTMDSMPTRIVHMWGVTPPGTFPDEPAPTVEKFYEAQESGFFSLIYIARAIGKENFSRDFHISVITDRMQSVTGEEPLSPEKMPVLSPVMIIPQEYPGIRCRSIDVTVSEPGTYKEDILIRQLLNEISAGATDRETVVSYRGNQRWVQVFDRVVLEKPAEDSKNPKLRENGVYFLPGGMGKIGLQISEYMARTVKAKLILTGRTSIPPREEWDRWLESHDKNDRISEKISRVRKVEAAGGEVLVLSADVANKEEMLAALELGERTFGPLNGVVFLPGIVKGDTFSPVRDIRKVHCLEQFLPKVDGLLVVEKLIRHKELDFCWMMSSLSAVLGGLGFVAYAGANIFIDALVKQHNRFHRVKWFSVDWEDEQADETRNGFERILRLEGAEQIVFCRGGRLHMMLDQWIKMETVKEEEGVVEESLQKCQPRPDLMNPYVPPGNETQKKLVHIWQKLLGFDSVGIKDDFLELGGDSLRAITMIGRVHKELNVSIPLPGFFENPTIEGLTEFISGAEEETYRTIDPVEKKEYYPLSSAQKRIYILQQMDPESISYNETNAGPIVGRFSKEELTGICLGLLKRHESLRTSFLHVDDEIVQRVHDFENLDFEVDYYDLAAPGAENIDSKTILRNFVRPFDFAEAPLVRVGLLAEKNGEQLIIVDMHHIVTDDSSLLLFMKDLDTVGRGEELKPLRIQYKDYASWQNSPAQKETLKKQETYWLKQFENGSSRMELPTDFERKPGVGVVGYLNALLPETVTERLETAAKEEEATNYMVFLALYSIFLSRITGTEDVLIGTLTAGRSHPDLEEIIGMFVNTLVLRNFPAPELTFGEFLAEVKKRTLEAFENQAYQFDDLVEHVVKNRVPGRNPLFDAAFSYYAEYREIPGVAPGRGEVTRGVLNAPPKFDFVLYVTDKEEGLYLSLLYNTGLFREETVERFYRYIEDICVIVTENPGIKLKDIMVSHALTTATAGLIEAEEGDFGF